MKICNIWNHFSTITRHRNLVRKHCFQIGLYWQGLTHDLSKYSPEEFWTGVRYYQGNRSPMRLSVRPWGIPGPGFTIRAGTSTIMSIGLTFSNHKEEGLVGNKMPLRYVAEMVCDRIAACEVYKGKAYTSAAPLEYYEYTKNYITIHPRTRALLEKLLHMLKDQGEEATFAYLRKLLKKGTY